MGIKDILNRYGIEMRTVINQDGSGQVSIEKEFLGGGNLEVLFNFLYRDPDEIDNEIISKIQHVINGNSPPLNEIDNTLGGLDTAAIIYKDAIRFHNPSNGAIVQTVPINDFNAIATAWRDLLADSQ